MFYNLTNLEDIVFSGFNTSLATGMYNLFGECYKLKSLDLSGFDVTKVGDFSNMFENCKSLKSLDLRTFVKTGQMVGVDSMFRMCESLESINMPDFAPKMDDCYGVFAGCKSLKSIDVSKWDLSECSYGNGTRELFAECASLTSLDISNFDMRKVVTTYRMFGGCTSLKTLILGDFETTSAGWMEGTFADCSSLETLDLGKMNTDNATDFGSMFAGCSSLKSIDLSKFNTSNVENMSGMFWNCNNLETIVGLSNFDTSKVNRYSGMFGGCTKLGNIDISNFDTSRCRDLSNMFMGCESMTTIDVSSFSTPYVMYLNSMFNGCKNLQSIVFGDNFYTGYAETMEDMFRDCVSLTRLDLSFFNTEAVKRFENFVTGCRNLEYLDISSFSFEHSETHDGFFYECWNMKYLNLGSIIDMRPGYWSTYELAKESQSCTIVCNSYTKERFCEQEVYIQHPGWFHFIDAIEYGKVVDLGLSVKWASYNVGATSRTQIGYRFAWGEIEPDKDHYNWDNYRFGQSGAFTKYNSTDGKTKLDPEDDAAAVLWGHKWRMPTYAEFQELVDNCTFESAVVDGVSGSLVTGPNGNTLFFPANGQYDESGLHFAGNNYYLWSSECDTNGSSYAACLCSMKSLGHSNHRHDGLCIRPVWGE